MATLQDVQAWKGMKAVDADGDKIGTIEDVFLDRQTGEPEWATVKTGLFGLKSSFVPLRGAEPVDDDTIRIPVDKELVKDAPKVDADGDLTPEEERRLWEHYGRSDYADWQGDDRSTQLDDQLAPTGTGGSDTGTGTGPGPDAGAGTETGEPAIVGVRLRRVVLVAAPAPDDR
jgi:sporulation protein YlmC with PRC-barrel domain